MGVSFCWIWVVVWFKIDVQIGMGSTTRQWPVLQQGSEWVRAILQHVYVYGIDFENLYSIHLRDFSFINFDNFDNFKLVVNSFWLNRWKDEQGMRGKENETFSVISRISWELKIHLQRWSMFCPWSICVYVYIYNFF